MKDHSNNIYEQDYFILNYQIKKDTIYVYYASGRVSRVMFSKKNEESILNEMKEQYTNIYVAYLDALKFRHSFGKKVTAAGSLMCVPSAVFAIQGITITREDIFLLGVLGMSFLVNGSIKYFKANSKLKDLEKTEYFLINQENLDININNCSPELLKIIADKTKTSIPIEHKKRSLVNLSSIDRMSLKSLKELKERIALEKEARAKYLRK